MRFPRSHTTTHHSREDSSGRVISSSQRPVTDNTQHSQETDIHAPGGIRTYNPSRRAAVDLRLRPRGHWDRLVSQMSQNYESHRVNSSISNTSVFQTNGIKIALFGMSTYIFVDTFQRLCVTRVSITLRMEASASYEMLKLSLLM